MIRYKRDVLERQSLPEFKMGRVRKMIVEYFENNIPQRQIAKDCKSHHLQCITLSKDVEELEKSLCIRDKAEDLCWMPVVFGPSDNTASLIGMILSLTLLNEPRNTSRNHCR